MHPAFGANWKNRIAMLFCSANHERVGQIHFYLWPDYRSDRAAALVGIRQRLAGPTSRGHSLLWQGEFQFSFPHRYLPAYQRPSNYSALAVPKMRRTGGPSASAQAGQSNWKVIRFQMLNPFPSSPCPISSPPGRGEGWVCEGWVHGPNTCANTKACATSQSRRHALER